MKKRKFVSVFTLICILICCAGVFYLVFADPLSGKDNFDSSAFRSGNAENDSQKNDSVSGDASLSESDNISQADDTDSIVPEDTEPLPTEVPVSEPSVGEPETTETDEIDDTSSKDDDADKPEQGKFYSVKKFNKLFPDADAKDLVGKIVNIAKKETVLLRRTTSKNAYLNGRLHLGDEVSVLKLGKNWVKVKKGKKTGYIYYKYISLSFK